MEQKVIERWVETVIQRAPPTEEDEFVARILDIATVSKVFDRLGRKTGWLVRRPFQLKLIRRVGHFVVAELYAELRRMPISPPPVTQPVRISLVGSAQNSPKEENLMAMEQTKTFPFNTIDNLPPAPGEEESLWEKTGSFLRGFATNHYVHILAASGLSFVGGYYVRGYLDGAGATVEELSEVIGS